MPVYVGLPTYGNYHHLTKEQTINELLGFTSEYIIISAMPQ